MRRQQSGPSISFFRTRLAPGICSKLEHKRAVFRARKLVVQMARPNSGRDLVSAAAWSRRESNPPGATKHGLEFWAALTSA